MNQLIGKSGRKRQHSKSKTPTMVIQYTKKKKFFFEKWSSVSKFKSTS